MVDYTDIKAVTAIDLFNVKLAEVHQKYVKLNKPFDEPCARLDFKDKVEQAEKESERSHGFVKVEDIKVEIGDLEKYGDANRFEFIRVEDTYGDKLSEDGRKTQGMIGYTTDYRCKQRGHGISIFVPLEGKEIVEHNENNIKKKRE